MEGIFRSMFEARLEEAIEDLALPEGSVKYPIRESLSLVWNPFSGSSEPSGFAVCDGSSGSVRYSGGLTVWLLRAACVLSESDPLAEVWVEVGHRLEGRRYCLRALELELLTRAVEVLPRGAIAVADGTLYPVLPLSAEVLVRRAKYVEVFLKALVKFLKTCLRREVTPVGFSKDSDVSYLRVRLALDYLKNRGIDIGRERSLKRIVKTLKALEDDSIVRLVMEELKVPSSDQEEVEFVTSDPGFTTPLVLAPHTLYLTEEIRAGTESWWDSRLRARWSRFEELKSIVELLDELYGIRPLYVTYWRPHHGLGVYRVDSLATFYQGNWGDLNIDEISENGVTHARSVASALNFLSTPPHTLRPLLDVDELVRLGKGTFMETYEPLIRDALRRKGFSVRLRRRVIRDLYLGRF